MKTVNIAELKDRLSHYLRLVRSGESVLVKDRDQVIARIEPAGVAGAIDDAEWLAQLERKGVVRVGKGGITPGQLARRRPKTSADVVAAVLDERAEGR